ncbi:hypothetical protein L1987_73041 [Smallanthus sonchifolius]|uniref:Uncharacterized protein n=1 Tax=Smallanthus sonchifolius TaxID=185202 RepID=A0ACB9AWH6_9ASTR|nr:hypothetical protein L1987_73041 [Smallanthus sonchifolius]
MNIMRGGLDLLSNLGLGGLRLGSQSTILNTYRREGEVSCEAGGKGDTIIFSVGIYQCWITLLWADMYAQCLFWFGMGRGGTRHTQCTKIKGADFLSGESVCCTGLGNSHYGLGCVWQQLRRVIFPWNSRNRVGGLDKSCGFVGGGMRVGTQITLITTTKRVKGGFHMASRGIFWGTPWACIIEKKERTKRRRIGEVINCLGVRLRLIEENAQLKKIKIGQGLEENRKITNFGGKHTETQKRKDWYKGYVGCCKPILRKVLNDLRTCTIDDSLDLTPKEKPAEKKSKVIMKDKSESKGSMGQEGRKTFKIIDSKVTGLKKVEESTLQPKGRGFAAPILSVNFNIGHKKEDPKHVHAFSADNIKVTKKSSMKEARDQIVRLKKQNKFDPKKVIQAVKFSDKNVSILGAGPVTEKMVFGANHKPNDSLKSEPKEDKNVEKGKKENAKSSYANVTSVRPLTEEELKAKEKGSNDSDGKKTEKEQVAELKDSSDGFQTVGRRNKPIKPPDLSSKPGGLASNNQNTSMGQGSPHKNQNRIGGSKGNRNYGMGAENKKSGQEKGLRKNHESNVNFSPKKSKSLNTTKTSMEGSVKRNEHQSIRQEYRVKNDGRSKNDQGGRTETIETENPFAALQNDMEVNHSIEVELCQEYLQLNDIKKRELDINSMRHFLYRLDNGVEISIFEDHFDLLEQDRIAAVMYFVDKKQWPNIDDFADWNHLQSKLFLKLSEKYGIKEDPDLVIMEEESDIESEDGESAAFMNVDAKGTHASSAPFISEISQ